MVSGLTRSQGMRFLLLRCSVVAESDPHIGDYLHRQFELRDEKKMQQWDLSMINIYHGLHLVVSADEPYARHMWMREYVKW